MKSRKGEEIKLEVVVSFFMICFAFLNESSALTMPGSIRILRGDGSIDKVDFQTYVECVLPSEWLPSMPDDALEAGAMAIKTYGWYWIINHKHNGGISYDLNDTPSDQVYDPSKEQSVTDDAVENTWFYEMLHSSQIFQSSYTAGVLGNANPGSLTQYGSALLADPTNPDWGGDPDNPPYDPYDWQGILHFAYDPITIDNQAQNPPPGCVGCPITGGQVPQALRATQQSNGVLLQWHSNGLEYDTAFVLYKRDSSTTTDISQAQPFARLNWTDYNQSFLDNLNSSTSWPQTTYYYSIAGINHIGEGPNSNEVKARMPSVSSYSLANRELFGPVGTISSSGTMTIQNANVFQGASVTIHGAPITILSKTIFFGNCAVNLVSP